MQPACDDCEGTCTQVLDRGERLEVLVQSTENLQTQAFSFKRDAGRLHRSMWWKDARMKVRYITCMALKCAGNVAALMYQLSSGLEIILVFVRCL